MTAARSKILVVEDEPNLLQSLCEVLKLAGYEILAAENGQRALELLREAGADIPHLIVSDIMMPEMNGYQFLAEVRREARWLRIPFIFLSALDTPEDQMIGYQHQADLYLVKPMDIEALLVAVEAMRERFDKLNREYQHSIDSVRDRIMTILYHEFRTPLTLVIAYADMLRDEEEELVMFLREINGGAVRLHRLIENFMLLIDIENGVAQRHYEQRKTRIDNIEAFIRRLVKQFMAEARNEHHVDVAIHQPVAPFIADPEHLHIILKELLTNAAKFSSPEFPVRLEVECSDSAVFFHVIDQGRGIPASKRESIFYPFEQINRHIHEDPGAGCGLAIVRGLVDLHGGLIGLESTPEVGSRFTVALPLDGQRLEDAPLADGSHKALRILVVEDEFNLRDSVVELLAMEGFDVTAAEHGQQALELLEAMGDDLPDLILSDIRMPVMDGLELLKNIRQQPRMVGVPFIFLTAKGTPADVNLGRAFGAERYLVKPVYIDELLMMINTTISRFISMNTLKTNAVDAIKRNIMEILGTNFQQPRNMVETIAQQVLDVSETVQEMDGETLQQFLGDLNLGAERLRNQVEQFLLRVEIDNGDAVRNYTGRKAHLDDMNAVVVEVITELRRLFGDRPIQIDIADPLPSFVTDRDYLVILLRELLASLLEHAVSSVPLRVHIYADNGNLRVEAHYAGSAIVLQPAEMDSDNGNRAAVILGLTRVFGGHVENQQWSGGGQVTLDLPMI